MYAVLYLKGMTLCWFEPILSLDEIDLPLHAYVWNVFKEELKSTFGKPDPVASATLKLDNLSMKDNHHIAKYNVEFNEYVLTSFNNHALYAKYYKGLMLHIKDGLIFTSCPTNLDGLRLRAQELDLHYWEQRDEDRSSAPSNGGSSSKLSGVKSTSGNATTSTSQCYRSNTVQSKPTSRASMPSASSSTLLSKLTSPVSWVWVVSFSQQRRNIVARMTFA